MNQNVDFDTIIIGGGPAGLTAGIYLSRSHVKTLILNEGTIGGQMILTHEIANYPGVENISGYQLSNIMKKQALSFGCEIRSNVSIKNVDFSGMSKAITLDDESVITANSIIIATGGRSRTLGVDGEDVFKGRGISYCATCDGDFFTNREIVVVGGGNSALEEAVSLTKHASKVTIVHQFDHFQAFEHAVLEAQQNPKIHFMMESGITSFNGDENLESVNIKNLSSNEVTTFKTDGVFIFIGYVPNTDVVKGKVDLNQWNEIVVNQDMATNITGVFAAGDSTAKRYRQVTTAVGDGTIAAMACSNYIHELKTKNKH